MENIDKNIDNEIKDDELINDYVDPITDHHETEKNKENTKITAKLLNLKEKRHQKTLFSKIISMIFYIVFGIFVFIFFLYMTFPYNILKEKLVSVVSEQMAIAGFSARINVAKLSPYWFTGVVLEDVTIGSIDDILAKTEIKELKMRLSLMPLLMGNISVYSEIRQKDTKNVNIMLDITIPISVLLKANKGSFKMDSIYGKIDFNKFNMDGILKLGLNYVKNTLPESTKMLLSSLLDSDVGATIRGGILIGEATNNKADFKVNLSFTELFFDFIELQIPKQSFNVANIDLEFSKNIITINKNTELKSEDIEIKLLGKIPLKNSIDLNTDFILRNEAESKLNIIYSLLKCQNIQTKKLSDKYMEKRIIAKLTTTSSGLTCTSIADIYQ